MDSFSDQARRSSINNVSRRGGRVGTHTKLDFGAVAAGDAVSRTMRGKTVTAPGPSVNYSSWGDEPEGQVEVMHHIWVMGRDGSGQGTGRGWAKRGFPGVRQTCRDRMRMREVVKQTWGEGLNDYLGPSASTKKERGSDTSTARPAFSPIVLFVLFLKKEEQKGESFCIFLASSTINSNNNQ